MKPTAVEQPRATRIRFVSGKTRIVPVSEREFEMAIVNAMKQGIPFISVSTLRGRLSIQLGAIETFEPAITGDIDSND